MDIGAFGRGGGKGGGKEACQICKRRGHSAKDCWQRGKGSGQPFNLTGDYGGGSSHGGDKPSGRGNTAKPGKPQGPSSQTGGGGSGAGKGPKCWRCNRHGHIAKNGK
eukprot:4228074-Karenia_brevis.AAC.1